MEVYLVSQDTVNNRSVIYVKAWGKSTSTTYTAWGGSAAYYVKVNGTTQASGTGINFSNMATVPLGTTPNITINHNADGTASFTASANFGHVASSLTGGYINTQTITLPTIPRTSMISSFPNFTIGSGVTVTAPRNSSGFTNEYHIYIGGTAIVTSPKVSADSYTFSAAQLDGIYAHIPSATTVTATAYVNTFSGTTLIGQSSATATASVGSNIIPTFTSVTAAETVAALSGMMTAGYYLQNYSRIKFTINGAAGAKSSSIASYKITFNGGTYGQNGTTGLINATGAITATATVTDTRGLTSTSKSVVCNLVAFPSNIGSYGNFNIGSGVSASKAKAANSSLQTKFVLTASGKNAAGTTTSFSKTIGPGTADSVSFTASDTSALYTITAEATSITVTLTATTHGANGAVIDTKTATATASVESSIKPSTSGLALTSLEQNTITSNLALGANTFVQGKSTIKFTAAGGSGGTGTKAGLTYSINFNGVNYANTSTTGTHNITGVKAARVTITDSRGRTNYSDFNLTFLAYAAPSIIRFTGARRELAASIVDITSQATISGLNSKNQLSYQISSRIKGGSWVVKTPWVNLAVGTTSLNIVPAYIDYDTTTSYDFLLEVKDKYNTIYSATFPVGTEQVTMSWGKFGIGVGKVHEDGALDVKGEVYIDGVSQDPRRNVWASIGTVNWYTIATCASGRAFGEFTVSDTGSGRHNITSFSASTTYGNNTITVSHGNRYGNRTIAHLRILYNSADRIYGGAKLQVYCENPPFTMYASMWKGIESDWGNWVLVAPVAEGTPSGWVEDSNSRTDDVTNSTPPSFVPTSRTVNGKALTGNISLTAGDVGAPISSDQSSPIAANNTTVNGLYYSNTSPIAGVSDGALINQAYSSAWQAQIFLDYRTGEMMTRGKNNGTWTAWLNTMRDGGSYSTIYLSSWYRSTGNTGWYSETHGGGWYMTDSTWIRNYGSKGVLLNGGLHISNDFNSSTTPRVVNTIMGTGNPPTASTVPQGTVYLKYV